MLFKKFFPKSAYFYFIKRLKRRPEIRRQRQKKFTPKKEQQEYLLRLAPESGKHGIVFTQRNLTIYNSLESPAFTQRELKLPGGEWEDAIEAQRAGSVPVP